MPSAKTYSITRSSVDSVLGKLGEDINFTTAPSKVIEQLLASGYELVSNNFTQGTKYGNSEENPNVNIFEVRVKHGVIPFSSRMILPS